jgi:hypothetical protein
VVVEIQDQIQYFQQLYPQVVDRVLIQHVHQVLQEIQVDLVEDHKLVLVQQEILHL